MAIGKGLLLLGGVAAGIGLLAAKKTPKAGEPGGTPASALPGAGQPVPAQVAAIMLEAMKTGDPARIRATADVLEKQGYLAQAADLRAGAVIIEQEQAKQKQTGGLASNAMSQALKASALATGDAVRMRATAAELRKAGYETDAAELETAAGIIEKIPQTVVMPSMPVPGVTLPTLATGTSPKVEPGGTPVVVAVPQVTTQPVPTTVLPNVVVTAPTSAPSAAAQKATFAGQTALMLQGATKATADEAMVQSYQQQNNLRKQDGKYGSETGLSLANTYDIVPPKPFYWGTKAGGYASYVADKKAYKSALLSKASADPQRAEEWTRAAAV